MSPSFITYSLPSLRTRPFALAAAMVPIAFNDMKEQGTMANAKAKGLVRSEGKEYVMKDGDIVNFLFNV